MLEDYGVFATFGANGHQDFAAMNAGITPIFLMEEVLDAVETEKQGRTVYKALERVRIHIAGDPFSAPVHPVDDFQKARFAKEYEAWTRDRTRTIPGTPLKEWPLATPIMIKELEAIHVYSVENLRDIADVHVGRIPDGRIMREKARAWLEVSKDTAAATRFAAENERMRDRLEELERAVAGLPALEAARAPVQARKSGKHFKRSPMSVETKAKLKAAWVLRKAKTDG